MTLGVQKGPGSHVMENDFVGQYYGCSKGRYDIDLNMRMSGHIAFGQVPSLFNN